ncbi:hypothetical protein AB0B45_12135 [Nonomuraea sp. NPDC049152]|uniref:hypothetical protein n=1 Tax=Nonomuraea sp. NPDC049152 TaxID=3154350 RepID=UPI0033E4BFE6
MSRNPRHQVHPSVADLPAAERSGALVRLWRIRTELLLAAGLVVIVLGALGGGRWVPFIALTSAVSVPAATRAGRGWLVAHAWCVASRHRLQRVCLETTMHTRSGRIPLILWITPTAVGEKALVLTRAGICAEDFEAFAGEIEAACFARDVRIHRHRRWTHLVIVEIIRREAPAGAVSPGLERLYGRSGWVALRSTRADIEEPPDTARLLVPA